jgi:hypothetical protein
MRWSTLLVGLLVGCDIVDETGYERCPDGTLVADLSMCPPEFGGEDMGGGGPPEASEEDSVAAPEDDGARGGLDPSLLTWTAEIAPGALPSPVIVLGLRGAVPEGASVSLLPLGGDAVEAAVSASAFVGVVEAAAGTQVEVYVDGVASGTVLIGTLRGLPALDDGEVFPEGDTLAPEGTPRRFNVGDGALGVPAPYVVFNRGNEGGDEGGGDAVAVEIGEQDVSFEARVGDTVCLARLAGFAELSTSACEVVR